MQWVLHYSFSCKEPAVKRVSENDGKRAPEVDDITWPRPKSKLEAVMSLKRRGYRPVH
ncbi:reverse transcriptase N-terminal domain-containing protein [Ralstonia chuxiongensis]|uniref:reverse transcriptase N-terminal domain-containing protein n=1 Tax=Ralstonia chuxiongensis TaxID=2957504 RepID=UPI00374398BB